MPGNKLNSTTHDRTKNRIKVSRIKRKILKNYRFARIVLVLMFIGIVFWSFFSINFLYSKVTSSLGFTLIRNFVSTSSELLPDTRGRINILIMGIGGPGHEGADNTDTMIVASIPTTPGKILLISIPRDLWIPSLGDRINSAYYWGNQRKPGSGIALAKSTVEEVLGIPIDNAVIFDFSSFVQVVNIVGGVDVNVVNSFTDPLYPIAGRENATCDGDPYYRCRYMTVSFTKGLAHMDGETALEFVRSRHAIGIEGTDLAREARQQQVFLALKNRLLDKNVYPDIGVWVGLFNVVKSSTTTDIDLPTVSYVARKILDSRVYSTNVIPENLLITPPPSKFFGAVVFIPRAGNGDWSEIQTWVNSLIK